MGVLMVMVVEVVGHILKPLRYLFPHQLLTMLLLEQQALLVLMVGIRILMLVAMLWRKAEAGLQAILGRQEDRRQVQLEQQNIVEVLGVMVRPMAEEAEVDVLAQMVLG